MNRRLIIITLTVIIFIAAFLRFYKLGEVPPSPNWDEVSLGYNAYSIVNTGRDEYGDLLPLILRSYDDYKPAIYTYFIIPFLGIFDLTVLAVRFPSAFFGVLAVLATYFLTCELMKMAKMQINANALGLLAAFLLAVSPWHIQFSRIGFESNVGTAFNIFAALFFIKGLKKHWFLLISIILIAINLYIYQSEKVFTPLLFTAAVIIFRKELTAMPKKYIIAAIILIFITFSSLIGFMLMNREILARARGVSVFSDQTEFLKYNVTRVMQDQTNNDVVGLILDNRRIVYVKTIIAGYISHFDLNWLFLTGDLARHHAPAMGLLYLFELPFLLTGLYVLIFGQFNKKTKIFLLSWFLIAPIPASVTSGVPHAVRTLNFLPVFQIFTALGLLIFITKILNIKCQVSKIQIRYLIFTLAILFFIFNFIYYVNQYFAQQNYFVSQDWQYGYKETVSEIKLIENKYDKIIVTNKPYLDQSYMFFLFYLKYSPSAYQKEAIYASGGFRENHQFGKYEFRPIDWDNEVKNSKILYIGRNDDFPPSAKIIKVINFLDGKPAIKIVEG